MTDFSPAEKPLRLYDSLTRKVKDFIPRDPKRVRLYTCGPTVYNYAHIGNLRAYIFTDTLRRALSWKGYPVFHIMNITDVGHLTSDADEGEDKMELAAQKEALSIWEIAEHYTKAFQSDLVKLNILTPSLFSKATDHIQEMIAFAQTLEDRGVTYQLDSGLYFDTTLVKDYGKLALLDIQGQKEGARIELVKGKRNPTDFAVWRNSPVDSKRLMEWDSPWGKGAPGWHLECSCMSLKYLGEDIDIHTGGIDHREVHHCNEIAQNQAYLGTDDGSVRYWLHNEFLVFGEDQKMSKSTGDFIRLQTIEAKRFHPLAYRYLNLTAKYRSPLSFNWEALDSAATGYRRLLRKIDDLREKVGELPWLHLFEEFDYQRGAPASTLLKRAGADLDQGAAEWLAKFDESISDDLNTSTVLASVFQLLSDELFPPDTTLRLIAFADVLLGLDLLVHREPGSASQPTTDGDKAQVEEIERQIAQRNLARQTKDFATADVIRKQLLGMGVVLHDSPEGTTWNWQ